MKVSGIYKIQSIAKPGRCYIGSAVDVAGRWRTHLCHLRQNKHHSLKLQRHFDKYGEQDLIFRIIEPCLPEFLTVIENTYFRPLPYFNVCKKADSQLGMKRSKESCKLMSDSHIGIQAGENHPMFGKHHSKETRKKQKDAKLLNPVRYWLGKNKPQSEDTKQKLKGNTNASGSRSKETKQKMRKPKSEQHKQNLKIAWINRKLKNLAS